VDYAAGERPVCVAMGRIDGDAYLDLVVVNHNSDNLSVFLNNGDGTFQAGVNYAISNGNEVIIVDLDGDGHQDLAVGADSPDIVSVFLNNGDGTFQAAGSYFLPDPPSSIAAGDLNGDGYQDLTMTASSRVCVLLGDGDGTFQNPTDYNYGEELDSGILQDLNGDGRLDLIILTGDGNSAGVFSGNGDGTFQAGTYDFYGVGNIPVSMVKGDLDGDGDQDFAVANQEGNDISILINQSSSSSSGGGSGGCFLAAATLNGLSGRGFVDLCLFSVVVWGLRPRRVLRK
ncbi:MAG: VCBS repeat-containing protein, partial [Desulfobacteraceae bacterium]